MLGGRVNGEAALCSEEGTFGPIVVMEVSSLGMKVQVKGFPGRGKSYCKGSGAGINPVYLRKKKKAFVGKKH